MLSSNRRPSVHTLTGGNSEVRCHRALIVCGACFSSPYASFEWMWTPITCFSSFLLSGCGHGGT